MALLLPPPGGRQVRRAPLDFPGQRHGCAADLGERPAWLDPAVDVDAAGAGRLRPSGQAEIREHVPGHQGDCDDLWPTDAGNRIQIHPQLIGMIKVVGADRVRIEVDAAQVRHPDELRRIPDDDLLRGPPGGEAQLDRLDPVRPGRRRSLLEERLAGRAVHEPLEDHRPSGHAAQCALGDSQVVPDHVQLGVPGLREVDLVRVADRHRAAGHLQDLLTIRHADHDNRS